jgi:hypothetical protein
MGRRNDAEGITEIVAALAPVSPCLSDALPGTHVRPGIAVLLAFFPLSAFAVNLVPISRRAD